MNVSIVVVLLSANLREFGPVTVTLLQNSPLVLRCALIYDLVTKCLERPRAIVVGTASECPIFTSPPLSLSPFTFSSGVQHSTVLAVCRLRGATGAYRCRTTTLILAAVQVSGRRARLRACDATAPTLPTYLYSTYTRALKYAQFAILRIPFLNYIGCRV